MLFLNDIASLIVACRHVLQVNVMSINKYIYIDFMEIIVAFFKAECALSLSLKSSLIERFSRE